MEEFYITINIQHHVYGEYFMENTPIKLVKNILNFPRTLSPEIVYLPVIK